MNIVAMLYGPPPIDSEHVCEFCGHQWTALEDVWGETKHYCPHCGRECLTPRTYNTLEKLVKDYPDKEEREKILSNMTNKELDVLLKHILKANGNEVNVIEYYSDYESKEIRRFDT